MPGPFGPAWRTAMCSGPSTAATRCRLRSLSLVLSLLFNPALSQTSWFEPKRLSTVPFGSTHFRGPDGGFQKPVLVPTAIQGFGNWSEPQDDPFSGQEDHCRPPRHGARRSYRGPRRRTWVGLYRSVMPGGWGFYLALAATISAS